MPPLGLGREWFRSPNGTKTRVNQKGRQHDNQSVKSPDPSSDANITKSLITQEDLEVEYLNEISKLTGEKEDAKDEYERRIRDNETLHTSLQESNSSLQSKVAELETQLREMDAKKSLSPPSTSDIPSASQETKSKELDDLKAKLHKYHESNKALTAKVQKLKLRRKEWDDNSEISSVGSLSFKSAHVSVNNSLQHTNTINELQKKYDGELEQKKKLELECNVLKVNKEKSEKLLEELKVRSVEQIEHHTSEMQNLRQDLLQAQDSLSKLQNGLEETRDDVADSMPNESNLENSEVQKHEQTIMCLESKIAEGNVEVEKLRFKLAEVEVERRNLQELQTTIKQLETKVNEKDQGIIALQVEKEQSMAQLESLQNVIEDFKVSSAKTGDELEQVKSMYEESKRKQSEMENMSQMFENKVTEENNYKSKFYNLQEQYSKETELNKSLKEKIKEQNGGVGISDSQVSNTNTSGEHDKMELLLQKEIIKNFKSDIEAKENEISQKNEMIKQVENEMEEGSSKYKRLEAIILETNLKNAKLIEDINSLEIRKQPQSNGNSNDKNKILELQQILTKKDIELRAIEGKSRGMIETSKRVEALKKELEEKTKKLNTLENEKDQSTKRLETMELDFVVTQQKNAKTWEELEELKDKLHTEQKVKKDLQNKLKEKDSVDALLSETRRLSEVAQQEKDNEIEKLKRNLTESNISKNAIEKKLLALRRDSLAQESSRQLMKQELEDQLQEENQKAIKLERLIKDKEDQIEHTREEFDNLAKSMQNEMEKRRGHITELNGDVLEKSNLLAAKDRELQYMKGKMDDIEIQHSSELNRLNRELSASVDKIELERLRKHNSELEYTILSLNQQIGKLRAMLVAQPSVEANSMDGSVKVLRTRNKRLQNEVEKLTSKLRRIKREREEI